MTAELPDADRRAIEALLQVVSAHEIETMAIGANARVLVIDGRHDLPSPRRTLDWDFAVRVDSWASFADLGEALRRSETLEVGGTSVRAPTAPWQIALKLLAYADRQASKDLQDVAFILDHGTEIAGARVFEELYGELADEGLSYPEAGPYLFGRDLAAEASPHVINLLKTTLSRLLDAPERLELRAALMSLGCLAEERAETHLAALLTGIDTGPSGVGRVP